MVSVGSCVVSLESRRWSRWHRRQGQTGQGSAGEGHPASLVMQAHRWSAMSGPQSRGGDGGCPTSFSSKLSGWWRWRYPKENSGRGTTPGEVYIWGDQSIDDDFLGRRPLRLPSDSFRNTQPRAQGGYTLTFVGLYQSQSGAVTGFCAAAQANFWLHLSYVSKFFTLNGTNRNAADMVVVLQLLLLQSPNPRSCF